MSNFIPKKSNKGAITIRLSSEQLKLIETLSKKYKLSRNEFISQCIDYAIKNMPDKNTSK